MSRKRPMRLVVRDAMTALGVYKKEFEPIIIIYCELREQYDVLTKTFITSGYDFSETTKEGSKKAPIVTTLETLRKDILAYASQLGLTPQGLLKTDDQAFAKKKTNALTDALRVVRSG